MSTTRTIRIEGNGLARTIIRATGPAGPAGVAGTPGSMTGPGSATADAIVLFNGTTGSVVKDSTVTLSGLATVAAVTAALALKQDTAVGMGLSEEDFTTVLKAKLDALGTATYKGSHVSLAALQAAHPAGAEGDWAHVEVAAAVLKVYHWDSVNASWQIGVDLSGKVDKVAGYVLSKNDFTDAYLSMLSTAVQTTTFEAAFNGLDAAVAVFEEHLVSPFDPHPDSYAGIRVVDGVTAQSVVTGASFVALTGFNTTEGFNDTSNDCTADKVNNRVAVTRTGRYRVEWSLTVSSDTAASVKAGIMKGGVLQSGGRAAVQAATIASFYHMSGVALLDVSSVAGTDGHLQLAVNHDSGGTVALAPVHAALIATRLGDSP